MKVHPSIIITFPSVVETPVPVIVKDTNQHSVVVFKQIMSSFTWMINPKSLRTVLRYAHRKLSCDSDVMSGYCSGSFEMMVCNLSFNFTHLHAFHIQIWSLGVPVHVHHNSCDIWGESRPSVITLNVVPPVALGNEDQAIR